MDYYELKLATTSSTANEIFTAELAALGFESFVEEDGCLLAYVQKPLFDQSGLDELLDSYKETFDLSYSLTEIPGQNWNAIWESNFQPIDIPGKLRVRALFHEPDPSFPLEIIIQPKMSFGTGHHATTYQVMDMLTDISLKDKKILDFGTGTGILAILAYKLGASHTWAVDNDPQCIENAAENFELNQCSGIHLVPGDIKATGAETFDIIIGNITRNVILNFLTDIAAKLHTGGYFAASGFYVPDLAMIAEQAKPLGLELVKQSEKDTWCAALFLKK